jgi:hypothetical protein
MLRRISSRLAHTLQTLRAKRFSRIRRRGYADLRR